MKKLVLMLAAVVVSAVAFLPGANGQVSPEPGVVTPESLVCFQWLKDWNVPCPAQSWAAEKVYNYGPGGEPFYASPGYAKRTGVGWKVWGGQVNNGVQTCLGPQAQVLVQFVTQTGEIVAGQRSPFGSCGEYYSGGEWNTGATYVKVYLRFYRADCVTVCNYRWIGSWSNYYN